MFRRGFTLVEMAVVLVLAGLMIGAATQMSMTSKGGECRQETTKKVLEIRNALDAFAHKYDRFPLPAARNIGVENPNYGREDSGAGIDAIGGASWGAVPFQALGLPTSYASDCWGNKLTYAVTTALTTNASTGGYMDSTVVGGISIYRTTLPTIISTTAAYAVISHGEDQIGAVKNNYSGVSHSWCSGTTSLEYYNCNLTGAVVANGVFNNGKNAGSAYFDDIIITANKPQVSSTALPDSNLYCWGNNASGQIGDGSSSSSTVPVLSGLANGIARYMMVTRGQNHTCALANNGAAYCWGSGGSGQLGDGTTASRTQPGVVTLPGSVTYFSDLVAGDNFTCGLSNAGVPYCWGDNTYGQLGDGTTTNRTTPVAVTLPGAVTTFKSITAGGNNACAIGNNDLPYCWGQNTYGSVGDGTTTTPRSTPTAVTLPTGVTTMSRLSTMANTTCGIANTGVTYCWGRNNYGQVGDASTTDRSSATAITVPSGVNYFTMLSVGNTFACGMGDNNQLYCWGRNDHGQLGDGTTTDRTSATAVSASIAFERFSARTGGASTVCANTHLGTTYCWGENSNGEVGDGTTTDRTTPTAVTMPTTPVTISRFGQLTSGSCAIPYTNLYCWGPNSTSAVGDATTTDRVMPQPVSLPSAVNKFVKVSRGAYHACALDDLGLAYCWGQNTYGELGDGTNTSRTAPTAVTMPGGVTSFTEISVSPANSTCAIGDNGRAYCWGRNNTGQLGDASTTNRSTPTAVALAAGVTYYYGISAGDSHTCAIGDNGRAYCWGDNTNGILGDASTTQRTSPTLVTLPTGTTTFKAISATSGDHTCAIANNDRIHCWGNNTYGQLGDTTTTSRTSAFVSTSQFYSAVDNTGGIHLWKELATGSNFSCGISLTNQLYCWGKGGLVGDSTSTDRTSPVLVTKPTGVMSFSDLSAMLTVACARGNNDKYYCWGSDTTGAIGDGTVTARTAPTEVKMPEGLIGYRTLAAYGCAVERTVSNAFCWGTNTYGSVGDNTLTTRATPREIALPQGVSGFTKVSTGVNETTCGIANNGKAYCWGRNNSAQIGDGTTTDRSVPTQVTITATMVTAGVTGFSDIDTGHSFTCGIANTGKGYCWGNPANGELGNGGSTSTTALLVTMPGSVRVFSALSTSAYHACAIGDNGKAYCWGLNSSYQLGDGTTTARSVPTLAAFPTGVTSYSAIAAGYNSTCAIGNNGKIYCWGDNTYSQLGDGTTTQRITPTLATMPAGVNYFTSITGKYAQGYCALADNGKAYCWGVTAQGQLGNGTTPATTTTPTVATLPTGAGKLTNVQAFEGFFCGTTDTGRLYCWGTDTDGRLGDRGTANKSLPSEVIGLPKVPGREWRTSPGYRQGCAVSAMPTSNMYCWGAGTSGDVGDGVTINRYAPANVGLPYGVNYFTYMGKGSNNNRTCASAENGNLYCWGNNTYGELGDGTKVNRTTPTLVSTPSAIDRYFNVTLGTTHTCALGAGGATNSNRIYCWGDNTYGQLGNNSTTASTAPVLADLPTGGATEYLQVSAGHLGTCGQTQNMKAYCWGDNTYGQIGDNTVIQRNKATTVALATGVTWYMSVSRGNYHACALGDNGRAYCWGRNDYGQVGDATTTTPRKTATLVSLPAGVTTFKSVVAADYYSCGIGNNGLAYCWGRNNVGQLGDGTTTDSSSAVAVTMPSGVTSLFALRGQGSTMCAFGNDGKNYCWGDDSTGAIGRGYTSAYANTPAAIAVPANVTRFAQSVGGSCAMKPMDSNLYMGGPNDFYQSDPSLMRRWRPVNVALPSGVTGFIKTNRGIYGACAIDNRNLGYCWGYGSPGQTGDGTTYSKDTPTAVTMPSGVTFRDIKFGRDYTVCALGDNGRIYCWGNGTIMGNGSSGNTTTPTLVSLPTGVTSFTQFSIAQRHACAIADDGNAYCWGLNASGQIGDSSNSTRNSPAKVTITAAMTTAGVTSFRKISAGLGDTTCALTNTYQIYCWGNNASGAFGNGTSGTTSNTPVLQPLYAGIAFFQDVSTPSDSACGLSNTGKMYCSGYAVGYELNAVAQTAPYASTIPPTTNTVIEFGHAQNGNVFQTNDGMPYTSLNVMDGRSSVATGGRIIRIPDGVYSVAFYGSYANMIADTPRNLYAWGNNANHQLSDGTTTDSSKPLQMANLPAGVVSFKDVVAGATKACGMGNNNLAYCWGYDAVSTSADGSAAERTVPTLVPLPASVYGLRAISIGNGGTSCILGDNSQIYCWGSDAYGQLGNGAPLSNSSSTVTVSLPGGISGWVYVAAGETHNCAIAHDGKAYCWGRNNYGQLGDGTTTDSSSPVVVTFPAGVTSFLSIKPFGNSTCAMTPTLQLYCWGYGADSVLGAGSTSNVTGGGSAATVVTLPANVDGWREYAVSTKGVCAVANSGTNFGKVYCWGANNKGQVGDGTTTARSTPTLATMPSGVTSFSSLSIGPGTTGLTTCALANTGRAYCWGDNAHGQIGDDSTTDRLVPTAAYDMFYPGTVKSFTKVVAGSFALGL